MTKLKASLLGTVAVSAMVLTGCGSSDSTPAQRNQAAVPACTKVVGLPTDQAANLDAGCDSDGDGQGDEVNMTANYDCPDGRKLFWNDTGWGYSGGKWQAHDRADGQLVPPQADLDACNHTSTEESTPEPEPSPSESTETAQPESDTKEESGSGAMDPNYFVEYFEAANLETVSPEYASEGLVTYCTAREAGDDQVTAGMKMLESHPKLSDERLSAHDNQVVGDAVLGAC